MEIAAIMEILNSNIIYIVIGLGFIIILLFILLMVNNHKLKTIQRKYTAFMTKEDIDLEKMLTHYARKVNKIESGYEDVSKEIENIKLDLSSCLKKVEVVRYNAIENVGADLSFVIAALNEHNDGFILNGIYSRDGSYTYAKPIEKGKSKYTLSDEEIKALNSALSK